MAHWPSNTFGIDGTVFWGAESAPSPGLLSWEAVVLVLHPAVFAHPCPTTIPLSFTRLPEDGAVFWGTESAPSPDLLSREAVILVLHPAVFAHRATHPLAAFTILTAEVAVS